MEKNEPEDLPPRPSPLMLIPLMLRMWLEPVIIRPNNPGRPPAQQLQHSVANYRAVGPDNLRKPPSQELQHSVANYRAVGLDNLRRPP
ncbi:hypothetical protein JRO89_XS12G0067000 [Xanthoceras sorbifolium]|uniref:Uncharacterized protein n=1 Tax=Xanthoceras sorbifolium TaxID=99658 RepID=A0ABQ8HBI2_9ROSI|nr:hypothetical protein JRO89_XS12G0067000 [Xanthoceras sorbifolium]